MIRPLARLAVAAGALSSAVWLLPAAVAINSWRADGPSRVAFLPPLASFWTALAITTALIAAAAYGWTRRSTLEEFSRSLSPLSLLLLWLVPFLPWLADRAPTLLVFAGPMRWAVAAVAVGATAAAVARRRGRGLFSASAEAPRVDRRIAFAFAFALYAFLGLRFVAAIGFTGDEPHYLVITHSIVADHDLEIGNNHERGDYHAFFSDRLRPDFLRRGARGEIYSIHAPGLPAVLAPAYALGGATGAVLAVALLAALASTAILALAEQLAGPRVALATWAGVSFSVPFVPHAWLIYPEIAAAAIASWSVLRLWQPSASVGGTVAYSAALGLLPWLHTKLVVLLVPFVAFEAMRLKPRPRHLFALIAPVGVISAAWLLSFYWMYGVLDPQAPYGTTAQSLVALRNIPRGVLGLVFDQKFGLLVYAPVYVLALPGAWMLLRDPAHRVRAAAIAATIGVFVISTTRFYMWWGGSSAPARFLVPIVPLLAPLIAAAVARLKGYYGRALAASTFIATLCIAVVVLASPRAKLLYSDAHGFASLLLAVQGPAPLNRLLPTFTEENWIASLAPLGWWIGAIVAACGFVVVFVRTRILQSSCWIATSAAVLWIGCAGLSAGRLPPASRSAAAVTGQLALLHAYDPSRLRAIDASRGRRLDDDSVRSAMTLDLPIANGETPAPVELAEGAYEARVWFAGAMPHAGGLQVLTREGAVIATIDGPLANPTTIGFQMPVSGAVAVRSTGIAAAAAARRVEISPVAVTARSARIVDRTVAVEAIGDAVMPGLLAYADSDSYPEHGVYWTRGTEQAETAITAANATGLKLIVHVGPPGGRVEVTAGEKRFDLDLQPNETREITVELGHPPSRTVVTARARNAFVPAEHESNNSDRRSLGCQVRPVLF